MGRFVLSPSASLQRRRTQFVITTMTTATGTPMHYAGARRAALLTTSGTHVCLALILECALLTVWGESLFVTSQPRFQMRVQGSVIDAERMLEGGAAETVRQLVGRN